MTRTVFPLLIASAVLCPGAALGAELPNVLWITCEDINPHLGCYGDVARLLKTMLREEER
jgi:hypothetical protein